MLNWYNNLFILKYQICNVFERKCQIVRKVVLLLLTFVLLFQGIVVCGISEVKCDGITYRHVENGLVIAKVDSSITTLNVNKIVKLGGTEYIVDSIAQGALNRSNVEVVNLPEEGINIKSGTFRGLNKLKVVNNLDKSNILSSDYLFYECSSLCSVNLPANLELVGSGMFGGCAALENVTISKNVKKIDEDSFLGCVSLNKISVEGGSNLKNIEKGAFAGCKNLEYFNICEHVDNVAEYAFFGCEKLSSDCNVLKNVMIYDNNLEEKCKQAELFARNILDSEIKNGRDPGDLVDAKDIDRLLYKYTPKATDKPTVVSKEEFDLIASDGRLVLYRGDIPCFGKNGQKITIKEINDAFKYGDYYYPFECNGVFCTKYVDHAKSYAIDYQTKKMIGSVTQFCFTDVSEDSLKIITSRELEKINDFYKYSHIENYLIFMKDWCSVGKYRLDTGLLNLGIDTMQFSFLARALGYDLIDNEVDVMGGDGCSKDTPTSQFEVLNRGKLTVCSENIFH